MSGSVRSPEHDGDAALPPGWPAPFTVGADDPAPLRGLRVLDLSRVLAGPLMTMQLGDLGATVLKIETPDGGDVTRGWPPFLPNGTSAYYCAINRNKRSVELDLASDDGRAVIATLAAGADVIVHNFLPGRLGRFGVDVAALRAGNPALVVAAVSGFGSDSPDADRPGFDFLAQAAGGVMAITGEAGGAPTRMGVAIVDVLAGLQLGQGVLAALVQAGRTGRGRDVEVALLDTAVFSLMNLASTHLMTGAPILRYGNQHPSISPYETLPVADGELAFAVGTDRQFARLAGALGLPELALDPRFTRNADRVAHRPALREALGVVLRTRTRAAWLALLADAGVPAAPVNEVADVLADAAVRARSVVEVDGVPQVRGPLRLDGSPLPARLRPPTPGEHTAEIRALLG